jgi:hypothetical protein
MKKLKNDSLDAGKCANIQIWTFKDGQWTPLADEKGNPYFIFLSFVHGYDRNTYQVLDYNWPTRS